MAVKAAAHSNPISPPYSSAPPTRAPTEEGIKNRPFNRFASLVLTRTDPPDLSHTKDCTRDAAKSSQDRCNSSWKEIRPVPALGCIVIVIIGLPEDEVFLEDDGDVYGEPIPEDVEEVLEGTCKVIRADDCERDIDGGDNAWPHETRDGGEEGSDDGDRHAHAAWCKRSLISLVWMAHRSLVRTCRH